MENAEDMEALNPNDRISLEFPSNDEESTDKNAKPAPGLNRDKE